MLPNSQIKTVLEEEEEEEEEEEGEPDVVFRMELCRRNESLHFGMRVAVALNNRDNKDNSVIDRSRRRGRVRSHWDRADEALRWIGGARTDECLMSLLPTKRELTTCFCCFGDVSLISPSLSPVLPVVVTGFLPPPMICTIYLLIPLYFFYFYFYFYFLQHILSGRMKWNFQIKSNQCHVKFVFLETS